jgi:hypothetical protein
MPSFLQIYAESEKNIKEIKRKKLPEINWSRKILLFLLSFQLILKKKRLCDFEEKVLQLCMRKCV